jgi:hypothetical protein
MNASNGRAIGQAPLSRTPRFSTPTISTGPSTTVRRASWGEMWDALTGVGPIDALKARTMANEALAAARNTGLPGLHNGPADAWRHCYWNCTMTGGIGADQARTIADNHERHGSGPAIENNMDQHNNAEGRGCGGSNCDTCCQGKLDRGELRVLDRPEDPANANLVPSSAAARSGDQQPDSSYSSEYYSDPPSGSGVDWSRKACCFVGQVPVATTTGLKDIDSISAGEMVLAYDPENGQSEYRRVLEVQVHDGSFPVLELNLSGETIAVTTRHRFGLVGGRWLSSELLQPQSALQSAQSQALVSQVSQAESWQGLVYNLKVEGGNYYVGQNLVLVRDH